MKAKKTEYPKTARGEKVSTKKVSVGYFIKCALITYLNSAKDLDFEQIALLNDFAAFVADCANNVGKNGKKGRV